VVTSLIATSIETSPACGMMGAMGTLLHIKNLTKLYDHHLIFQGASLTVAEKEKIALIGRNGVGKSTLFKIIVGLEEAQEGEVQIFPGTKLGYLEQHDPYSPDETVIGFLTRHSERPEWECAKMAASFEFKGEMLERTIGSFAGGYQMRIKIIAMLLEEPNLLLLDEPTNYLDISTQLLLERFLKSYNGGFILISHDREFIKKTCTQTVELEHGAMTKFPQGLDEYFAEKERSLALKKKTNVKIEKQKAHLKAFYDRFAAKASKASSAQSKLKQYEKLQTLDIKTSEKIATIRIPKVPKKSGIGLHIEDLTIGYKDKEVASSITMDIERGEHIAVLGDNGQGKSTFLKTIAGELSPKGGSMRWAAGSSLGYYAQHVLGLMQTEQTVKDYLKSQAPSDVDDQMIFEMAGNFLFKDEALKKPLTVLSGGEKARLYLAGLLLQRHTVLLIDEPTNHLDVETVDALANALKQTNSMVIFVSHNRAFVETLATGVIHVGGGKVKRYRHGYEEYMKDMERRVAQAVPVTSSESTVLSEEGSMSKGKEAHQRRAQRKELEKALKKQEKELTKVSSEKKKLLEWFEVHYSNYSPEKQKELSLLEEQEERLEAECLRLMMEIERL